MNSNTPTRSALARASIALVAVLFLATACSALPAGLFGVEATAAPEPTPSPVPIPSPVPTPKDVCTALVDLEAAVEDLGAANLDPRPFPVGQLNPQPTPANLHHHKLRPAM